MGQRGAPLPNLKRYRLLAGMTQAQLAQAAGVSMTTINRLERLPDAPAEARTAAVLARVLDVRIADLMASPAEGPAR